jgi:hypothetical protein
MRELFGIFRRLYDTRILAAFAMVFGLVAVDIKVIPDFFNLSVIESHNDVLVNLWRVVIGSSSFILTILIVVYNSHLKVVRRNSIELLSDDPWMRLLFSSYVGSFMFLSASILLFNILSSSVIVTLTYLGFAVTIGVLIFQFPLIILSLKHSSSFGRIRSLLNEVTDNEIVQLYRPSFDTEGIQFLEQMERNRIILLKDIGLSGIQERDWSLPQSIVSELYLKLIRPLKATDSEEKAQSRVFAFQFVCNHFKNSAIAHADIITIRALLSTLVRVHRHIAKSGIRSVRAHTLATYTKDFYREILNKGEFYNIQEYLKRDAIEIVKIYIETTSYTDEELSTLEFELSKRGEDRDENGQCSEILNNYWFFLKHDLRDILFDTMDYALQNKNRNVTQYVSWGIQQLMGIVYDSKNLTIFQREDLFQDYYYRASVFTDNAIANGMYKNIEAFSNHQIEKWLIEDRKSAFRCLYYYSNLLEKLNKIGQLSNSVVDRYFFMVRSMSDKKMNQEVKESAIIEITDTGLKLCASQEASETLKAEIARQLDWNYRNFISDDSNLETLAAKYSEPMQKLTETYSKKWDSWG